MKPYKAVIFDIDGTILDTARMNIEPLQTILFRELKKMYTYQELEPLVAYSGTVILQKMGIPDSENKRVLEEWIIEIQRSGIVSILFDGIQEVFQYLKDKGIALGIVSSKESKQYQFDIVSKGLDTYFDAVVLADDTAKHKPHPEPMMECLRRLQLRGEDCLYVGDTDADAICAYRTGCDFAYAAWGPLTLQEPCTYELQQPKDLIVLWEREVHEQQ